MSARRSRAKGERRRRKGWRRLARVVAGLVALAAISGALVWHLAPFDFERLEGFPVSPRVVDRDGELIDVRVSEEDEICLPVALESMSPWLRWATIAVEDRRFASHPGVDLLAALRAVGQNLARREVHSGASTLTMQLARIVRPRRRTLWAKAVEAVHALQITLRSTKDETLERYLNLAPYGGNIRGVEAASLRYFGKHAAELTLAEASLVAGIPQSPSWLRPDRHYERALRRRRLVLEAMEREGYITAAHRDEVQLTRPPVRRRPWPLLAPHFARRARRSASSECGGGILLSTLDPSVQSAAEERLREFLRERAASRRTLGGAVVVIEVESGAVRALVGSPDFFDDARCGQVNAATARRSPGSTLKPFLYALAYDRGLAAPSTYLADVPTPFVAYDPENFDRRYHGPVPAGEALSRSLNVPAVRLQRRVGTAAFLEALGELGITTLDGGADRYGLTLSLGGGEVRLLELTNAYAALSRLGVWRPCRFEVATGSPPGCRVLSAAASWLVLSSLGGEEHLRRASSRPVDPGPLRRAYKTGTSFGQRDAWAIAISPRWAVGVWLGDPRGPAHPDLVGVEAAAPVALDILDGIETPFPGSWPRPPSVVTRRVCATSGYPAGPACPSCREALFPGGAPSPRTCRVHRRAASPPGGGGGPAPFVASVERWPADVERWMERHRAPTRRRTGETERGARGEGAVVLDHGAANRAVGRAPRILSPPDGSRYRWIPGVRLRQEIALSAAADRGVHRLHWFVDGHRVASAEPTEEVFWPLRPGRHEIRCVDDRGRSSAGRVIVDAPAFLARALVGR